jgi:hypothetical protein
MTCEHKDPRFGADCDPVHITFGWGGGFASAESYTCECGARRLMLYRVEQAGHIEMSAHPPIPQFMTVPIGDTGWVLSARKDAKEDFNQISADPEIAPGSEAAK